MTQLGLFTGVYRDALAPFATDGKTSNSAFSRANLPRFGLYDSASDTGSVGSTSGSCSAQPTFDVP